MGNGKVFDGSAFTGIEIRTIIHHIVLFNKEIDESQIFIAILTRNDIVIQAPKLFFYKKNT